MASAVIIAGGGGTRFWPKSRKKFPKQCINILGTNSMIEVTAERIKTIIPKENIYISTGQTIFNIMRDFPLLKGTHFILEPMPRNTAAAIGLSALVVNSEKKDEIIVVLPADSYIRDTEEYLKYLEKAIELAKSDKIVLLGIKPTYPSTGLGYMQKGAQTEKSWVEISEVKSFKEKPDETTAKQYVDSREYLWNSGQFIAKTSVFIDQIRRYMPELYYALRTIKESGFEKEVVAQEFEKLEKISIDYGVMEKAYDKLTVITGDFYWDDIGDWAAMQRVIEVDDGENAIDADVEGDNEDCIIFGDEKIIEMEGFKGLIVVDTKDALLVCRKERAQDVKKVVEILEKNEKLKTYAEDFVEKPEKHYVPIDCEHVYAKNINKLLATIGLKDINIEEKEDRIIIKNR